MNNNANVKLSEAELELLCQSNWILTKQRIIDKIYSLYGHCATQMQEQLPTNTWPEIRQTPPKIAKGEQYQQLPWVMLDYPRLFTATNTAAIRSFCWWGNFCSICLQLAGETLAPALPGLKNNFARLQAAGFYICVSADAWQHHFESDNFLPLEHLSENEYLQILTSKPFVKLAKKIPLQQWDEIEYFLMENFGLLCQYLPKHPGDGANL